MKNIWKSLFAVIGVTLGNYAVMVATAWIIQKSTSQSIDAVLTSSMFAVESYLASIIYTILMFFVFFDHYDAEVNIIRKEEILKIVGSGIVLSLALNFIIGKIQGTTIYNVNFFLILETGLLGPLLEEYLFRGYVYTTLQSSFSKATSMILTTIFFALSHTNLISILYALLMGSILIYLYEHYKTLKAPIMFHIAINMTAVVLTAFLF